MKPIHYLQIVDSRGQFTPFQEKCIASVKRFIKPEDTYETQTVPFTEDTGALIASVDRIKMGAACEIPNLCLVDTDCFLTERPDFDSFPAGKPVFGKYTYSRETKYLPDIFLFYVNGSSGYFKKHFPIELLSPKRYSFPRELFKQLMDYTFFDDMTYLHSYTSIKEVLFSNELRTLQKVQSNMAMEVTTYRKIIEQAALTMSAFTKLSQKE